MNQYNANPYIGYEYKEIIVSPEQVSLYLDCYENFGWQLDGNIPAHNGISKTIIRLKRDRKIANKMELTRLQRNFEACAKEIETLENSKHNVATMKSLITGIIGTAFMAGSTFSIVNQPPIIWLCVLLAIPGFIGWIEKH